MARDRRLAPGVEQVSLLGRVTAQTTAVVDTATSRRRGRALRRDGSSNWPGSRPTPSQFLIVVASFASVLGLLGVVLGLANGTSILLGLLFAILTPIGAKVMLNVRTSPATREVRRPDRRHGAAHRRVAARRPRTLHGDRVSGERSRFADERGAGSSRERVAARPTTSPRRSAVVAERMQSKDFEWVAQAIAHQRRDRWQPRGSARPGRQDDSRAQPDASTGEGAQRRGAALGHRSSSCCRSRVFLFFAFIQPTYTAAFFENIFGILALIVAAMLMIIGSIWISFVVRVKF